MKEEEKTLVRYYALTIPHITLFAGAILGILMLMKADFILSLGIFSTLYGLMLLIVGIIVKDHFWELTLYKLSLLAFSLFILFGLILISMSIF
ncbi:hypothetical protein PFDSM3638_02240 [Pyrococcus furiosus DSM 3638]|uniref:Uncharacterized protein n=3 Tax=Pyrococcus furiosus TaxID=2261 RepID=Q8U3L5_PYRFU|nr:MULTISPECIES: hypothetical protein [Pyrococcus]AAL80575.1 hypothetical protein PF0451 [Pyrococcus furiosus DSM 3638]AFN03245.1 hypothetical protein PFC_01370 [Pyrococcus furiosus COM1]MDK2869081.1 hypothetical protein [Pyrococcus sp.]QEK78164.1 hypothetical protein PFDSM3638_02240 [Pyrococcus furiosus DSM 3638]